MVKVCPCGKEITRNQYCAENERQWAKRESSGFCRPKCSRAYKLLPSPKVQTMELVSRRVGAREEMVTLEKEKRVEDTKYLEWIRSLPCLVPGCGYQSEAHHQNEKGHGGKGTRADDYRAVPVCFFHHTMGGTVAAPGSYHGMGGTTGRRFWQKYAIDVETVIHDLNRAWLEQGRKFKEG
jgi:hypothetical protein